MGQEFIKRRSMLRAGRLLIAGSSTAMVAPTSQAQQQSLQATGQNGIPVFNVRHFGAAGNGKARDTQAIQKTIDVCHAARGGTVYFPAGEYLTGTIVLKSNVTLYLHVSATILGSEQMAD